MDRPSMDQGAARTAAELRLQLAQVTAASQMLERTATDESSRKYLAALEQGVCRMLRTVGRLELSQRLGGDAGPELQRKPVDLALLSNELGARLGELLAWAEVELAVSTTDRPPCTSRPWLIFSLGGVDRTAETTTSSVVRTSSQTLRRS